MIFDKLQELPEFLTHKHLIELGLYETPGALYFARIRGNSPDFVKIGVKVFYPKKSVIQWLEHNFHVQDKK